LDVAPRKTKKRSTGNKFYRPESDSIP